MTKFISFLESGAFSLDQRHLILRCNWLWWFGDTSVQSPVDSPHEGPVNPSFDAFFAVILNKLLKQELSVKDLRDYDVHVTTLQYLSHRYVCIVESNCKT